LLGGLKAAIVGRPLKAAEAQGTALVRSRRDGDGADIILTNPPFAGAIKTASTLSQYELATGGGASFEKSVVRAILFLERCLDMLRPGGRLAIVLPQGLLRNRPATTTVCAFGRWQFGLAIVEGVLAVVRL
jgi:type I restriction enzyme M protein